ncbi:pectin lyase fold/virulence factor [Aspergillus alliaceus]|uniref:pectin lyase fold/virulence factor n=1 Tax=Petromyces alliaceus TaxID=209559 RepID=UPI0012A5B16C|nr:pectin lyase fold/virulence factor [Aspergillus alliaceus]KAB8235738.1 pectin lyase fold/virulence factor [Aspergillus alliaceus]
MPSAEAVNVDKTMVRVDCGEIFGGYSVNLYVQGTPFCFAAGTTGGGNAKPAAPSSLKVCSYASRLVQWLTDDTPRALIDREWNFTGTEDTTNDRCCVTKVTTCEGGTSKGQAWIQDKCADGKFEPCKSAPTKSIVGVGNKGVIRGKGLRITNGNKNVIIQIIHFTISSDLEHRIEPSVTFTGCDQIWIDHNKFSLIGRQHIVSGWQPAGHVTISNNEFDGRTYGHSFDVDTTLGCPLERNVWESVGTPITDTALKSGTVIYNLSKSAQFPRADADVLKKASTYKASIPPNTPVANVPKNVTANAGVAKLK